MEQEVLSNCVDQTTDHYVCTRYPEAEFMPQGVKDGGKHGVEKYGPNCGLEHGNRIEMMNQKTISNVDQFETNNNIAHPDTIRDAMNMSEAVETHCPDEEWHKKCVQESINKIQCSVCEEKYDNITEYTHHLNMHSQGSDNQSVTNNDRAPVKGFNVLKGMLASPSLSCAMCDRTFGSESTLNKHIDIVHRKWTHRCPLCYHYYASESVLANHISSVHHKLKPYSCTWCDKSFVYKRDLTAHVNSVHHEIDNDLVHNNQKHRCPLCYQYYISESVLKKHISVVHHKLKSFSCTLCDKSFAYKSTLRAHVNLVHHKVRTASNQSLDKNSTVTTIVNSHSTSTLNNGTSDLPSAAEENMHQSQSNRSLSENNHSAPKTNTEEDTGILTCSQCSAQFYMKESLEKHAAIHTQN